MKRKIYMAATVIMAAALIFTGCGKKTQKDDTKEKEQETEAVEIPEQMGSEDDLVIVIDAGHGADDPGSIAISGAYEKDINLQIAKAMKDELGKYAGVKVYLTRSTDDWSSNTGRAMFAKAVDADFLISVHNNSGSDTNSGCIGYRTLNENYSEITNDVCALLTENLALLGFNNGGVQTRESTEYVGEDYYTLIAEGVRVGIPSIIVEHCFLSNQTDCDMVTNSDGSIKTEMTTAMGKADAQAFVTYYGLTERTAVADDKTAVTLEKGYSVTLDTPVTIVETPTWYSVDDTVATVDEKGMVTAVGSGTTNIVYKLEDGTTGYIVIHVNDATPVALSGAIDPTFYYSADELSDIDLSSAFAFVAYSDGTAEKVSPTVSGTVDSTKSGPQDLPISYNDLQGTLRIVYANDSYVPEVTLPADYEEPTSAAAGETLATDETTIAEETTVEETTAAVATTQAAAEKSGKDTSWIKDMLKYLIILLVIVVIGILFLIVELNRRKRRRRRRNKSRKRL